MKPITRRRRKLGQRNALFKRTRREADCATSRWPLAVPSRLAAEHAQAALVCCPQLHFMDPTGGQQQGAPEFAAAQQAPTQEQLDDCNMPPWR